MNILQHHNRIVHHQANRQHDAEQCQNVDGETEYPQKETRADQRHRDGDKRNQRRAKRAQEQEDHQGDQHHGFDYGAIHRVDRRVDEQRRIERNKHVDAFRQRRLNARQLRFDRLRHTQRIRRRLFDHAQPHRSLAIDAHDIALVRRAQFSAPDVF